MLKLGPGTGVEVRGSQLVSCNKTYIFGAIIFNDSRFPLCCFQLESLMKTDAHFDRRKC
jgi:hypothetical protein